MPSPPSSNAKTHARLLELAWSLAPLSDREELTRASAEGIRSIIGGDEVHFNDIELSSRRVTVRVYPDEARSSEETALFGSLVRDHPVSQHSLGTRKPCRSGSPIFPLGQLRRSEIYDVLLRPHGMQFQLICPLRLDGGDDGSAVNGGSAFAISRARNDFRRKRFAPRSACN